MDMKLDNEFDGYFWVKGFKDSVVSNCFIILSILCIDVIKMDIGFVNTNSARKCQR